MPVEHRPGRRHAGRESFRHIGPCPAHRVLPDPVRRNGALLFAGPSADMVKEAGKLTNPPFDRNRRVLPNRAKERRLRDVRIFYRGRQSAHRQSRLYRPAAPAAPVMLQKSCRLGENGRNPGNPAVPRADHDVTACACSGAAACLSHEHGLSLCVPRGLARRPSPADQRLGISGGGSHPPSSRSSNPATASATWSRHGCATTCTPIGRPAVEVPQRTTAQGQPVRL